MFNHEQIFVPIAVGTRVAKTKFYWNFLLKIVILFFTFAVVYPGIGIGIGCGSNDALHILTRCLLEKRLLTDDY